MCFKVKADKDGLEYNLITQYDKLTLQDVITHSKAIWRSGAGFDIPDSTSSLTQENI